jgi:nucleolar protein 56
MHYLAISTIGLFVFNEKNELLKYKFFEKDPKIIAERLLSIERKEEIPEITALKRKFKDLITEQPNQATEYLRKNLRKIVFELGFVKDDAELNSILNKILITKTRLKISSLQRRDKLIIQTVSALNDLDKILNSMSERLREWYTLHYPELNVKDHEKFAELIAKYGHRKNFEDFTGSMGMNLEDEDIRIIQGYAKLLKELYTLRKDMEKYLRKIVSKEIPNLNTLLGSLLAARLLALAGSLEKLAKMPSSTIQLLGAEKSLFKFLRGRKIKKPPKFGLLFLHPDICGAKKELQGKIARLLSSKLTIAARADFYTKKDMSKKLLEDYRRKLKEILEG